MSLGAGPKQQFDLEPEIAAPVFPVEPAWEVTLDAPPSAAGALDRDHAYIPLQSGRLIALDRETGKARWTTNIETRWPPLAYAGHVVVAGRDALRAYDSATGREKWTTPTAALSAPLSTGTDCILAVTTGGEVLAWHQDNGALMWKHTLGGAATQPPAMGEGVVAVVLDGSRVIALQAATGTVAWTRTLDGTLSPPVFAHDRVLIGSTTNWLYALEAERGDTVWRTRAGGDVIGAAVDDDVVYFASLDNILRAVNRGNGNQRWKTVIPTRPAAPPVAFDGVVVLSGIAPRVDGYEGKTGKTQGSYTAPADLQGTALIDALLPYRVTMVTISRDGRVSATRSQAMMMRDPAASPLTALPGRRLGRERLPSLER